MHAHTETVYYRYYNTCFSDRADFHNVKRIRKHKSIKHSSLENVDLQKALYSETGNSSQTRSMLMTFSCSTLNNIINMFSFVPCTVCQLVWA